MTRPFAFLLVLSLPGLSLAAPAEEQDVERGQRVRVTTTAGERLTGRVGDKSSDALVVELDEEGGSRSIRLADVTSVETGRPQSRCRAAWSSGKWWALIGAASGTTLAFQHEQVREDGATVAEAAALGAWSGGLLGGLIGAAIGALSPGEEWVRVSPAVGAGRGEFSLSVTLTF